MIEHQPHLTNLHTRKHAHSPESSMDPCVLSNLPQSISANGTTTTTTTTVRNLVNIKTNHELNSELNRDAFSNSTSRRISDSSPPKPSIAFAVVFPEWKPSERVLRLKPEQIEEIRIRLNVDVTVNRDSPSAPAPIESFADMCLDESIMKDIAIHQYTTPTCIQAQAMPVALSGRDLFGCAERGSGITAAFTIPMIQHCIAQVPVERGDGPIALVLAPTGELARHIEKKVKAFSQSLESSRIAIVVDGRKIDDQRFELREGVDIVVATPGRFIEHFHARNISLTRISYVVLVEADRMFDMGYEPQIREVMHNLGEKHQTLVFSETMPVEVEILAQKYLTNPVRVKVGKVSSSSLTANVSQTLKKVDEVEKIDGLVSLLVEEAAQAQKAGRPFPLTIVFVERKEMMRCYEVDAALRDKGLYAYALDSGCTNSEREAALHDFMQGRSRILVATELGTRGLDVTGFAHVVNLDFPKTMEDYAHSIARTGSTGRATSLYTDCDMVLVSKIKRAIGDVECGVAFTSGREREKKESVIQDVEGEYKCITLARGYQQPGGGCGIRKKVYLLMCVGMAAFAIGDYCDGAWEIGGILTASGLCGCAWWMVHMTPPFRIKSMVSLVGFSFFLGVAFAPIINALELSIVMRALMAAATVVAGAAMSANIAQGYLNVTLARACFPASVLGWFLIFHILFFGSFVFFHSWLCLAFLGCAGAILDHTLQITQKEKEDGRDWFLHAIRLSLQSAMLFALAFIFCWVHFGPSFWECTPKVAESSSKV